ncbi:flagellar biosynthetic protein FliO [Pseudorhodoplanes sp.]|uniref:flagellar biosynthetic protein FliO n=1 Tax=Pseudorhodoplanes sp. TaxID=1934341 RepID=UPI002B90AB70|nr:flagellar biosynthetic protein FliO [Pseudorhodoplanes sp.]HWV51556.1 flagellar biosynthetic protein FliO [Pseudorhodoplanes sp.]
MDSLFGEGTSLPVRFFIAFVVVFALIGVTAWLVRRFGSGALGGTSTRGRAPRLAVIEAGAVDGRRKLVLIRRDNIEHLIMIGGPTDIVVEANIVRGQSPRDAAGSRTSPAADNLTRAVAAEETAWPLQPEATPRPASAARAAGDTTHWALPAEPAAPATPAAPVAPKRSRSADALAGLAAELSVTPAEPTVATPRPVAPTIEAVKPKPAPVPTPATTAADQNLADMASRLEAALRRPAPAAATSPAPVVARPKPAAEGPHVAPQVAPPVAPPVVPPAPPVAQEPSVVPAPATAPVVSIEPEKKPDDKPAKSSGDPFGSIEQEMANLLGRPSGKPS